MKKKKKLNKRITAFTEEFLKLLLKTAFYFMKQSFISELPNLLNQVCQGFLKVMFYDDKKAIEMQLH